MTLQEACKQALTILKQVMEEKLSATNVEVYIAVVSYDSFFQESERHFTQINRTVIELSLL